MTRTGAAYVVEIPVVCWITAWLGVVGLWILRWPRDLPVSSRDTSGGEVSQRRVKLLGVEGSRCGATPIGIRVTVVVDTPDGKHWIGLRSSLVYMKQMRSPADEGLLSYARA